MSGPKRGALFLACGTLPDYEEAVTRLLADDGEGEPVPVWSGGRTGLRDAIDLAEQVYGSRRVPAPSATGIVLGGPLPEPLQRLARPLARDWVPSASDLPDSGSVLLIGTYGDLRADAVQEVIEQAHAQGRPLFLLTGRDVHTLSWMVAKQYANVVPHADVGMFSELDALAPVPGTVWLGAEDVRHRDVQSIALGRVWSRVLFHGNGKDDQLNLGQFTLCGLSPVGERQPGADGPKCAYGLGCPKPEDKLIPVRRIRAAELVLGNCFSGPLSDHAMYDAKYVILLDALDGPAQTVVATLTACDAQRPENLAWLTGTALRGSAAGAINERLKDINPYPAFVQIGLQSSGLTEQNATAGEEPGERPEDGESRVPLHTLGARLSGLLDSGLLTDEHPLRPRLRQLADTVLGAAAVRTVLLSPRDGACALSEVGAETKSLDLALAQRLAKHHDDPVLGFPTYFGERSVAGEPIELDRPCACGRPLRSYTRRGRLPVVTDTVQAVCARCGDVANSHVDAPELRVRSAGRTSPGDRLHVTLEALPHRAGTVNMGIVLPTYLNARVRPALCREEASAGGTARAEFEIEMAPQATPQAYYFTPYAVQDLGISTRRVHFTLTGSPTS
ncbi:hypothetical protein ACFXDJ_15370 [Streptomyces sp. NPDC059443]|uniref:hypothetical protein n=1 Tax=unclassified Streptomyces TaxID=2593676 RepID=UPI0036B9E467